MSGDVHYGRVVSVKLGTQGATLYEVVSSPLSNLTYLNAWFATSRNRLTPKQFPDQRAFSHAEGKQSLKGWQPQACQSLPEQDTGRFQIRHRTQDQLAAVGLPGHPHP